MMNKIKILMAVLTPLFILYLYYGWFVTYPDWRDDSHSNAVSPDIESVFLSNDVKRIDLTIDEADWAAMWSDLEENLGGGGRMLGGREEGNTDLDFTPIWVPCRVSYEGCDWYEVGVRFKGNSSLMRAYSEGCKKISMKLDFDEFEDIYPDLKNQRFFGFKQLNLNSNFEDPSFLREKVVPDLLRQFGVPAAHTVFCELYIDFGQGAQYYGLYTIVEVVDDTLIKTQFTDGSGNIYKPEERAGSFAEGSYETSEFNLKGGKGDYSDVLALYTLLHSSDRESNQMLWCEQLESLFDVDMFLKWLAANSVIQNWDSYGNMAHNYYLYNNPKNHKLTWIPWDHNEALQEGRNTYEPARLALAGSEWPLFSYIMSVDKYQALYVEYLRRFTTEVFEPKAMMALYDQYYKSLKESVYHEVSGRTYLSYYKQFDENIERLKSHVVSRQEAMLEYLADPVAAQQRAALQGGGMGDRMSGRGGGGRMMPDFEGGMPPMGFEGAPPMDGDSMRMRERPMRGGMQDGMRGEGMRGEGMRGEGMPGGRRGAPGAMLEAIVEGELLPMEGDSLASGFGGRR